MINLFWTLKFIFLNFKQYKKKDSKKIILVELFNFKGSIISNGLFASELSKIHNAKLVGFEPNFQNIKNFIKSFLYKINIFSHYNVYRSFGFSNFLIPKESYSFKDNKKIFKKILKRIKYKKDILEIKINNVKIGDLIYDGYLRENRFSTIDFKSKEFHEYLYKSIKLFFYWNDYLSKNNVVGLIISHSVYLTAIPLRIACAKNISVFNVSYSSAYKLTKNKPLKFAYFSEYPKLFKKIKFKKKIELKRISKKNIDLRLSGKKDLLFKESQPLKEAIYSNFKIKKKISKSKNIIIAAHDFTDAPHVHGKMIFNDFHDWIDFLGKKSMEIKNYNWLIKLHPAEYDENLKYVNFFLKKYPSLKLLPKNTNHNKLLSKGVACVLTTYGSIAHEYPLFGIPVINAGENPHSGYNFSINPKSFKEYNYLVSNISKVKKPINVSQSVYEFYSMYHLVDFNIFEELEFSEKKTNSYFIYKHFLKKYDMIGQTKLKKKYDIFIKSKRRRFVKFFL